MNKFLLSCVAVVSLFSVSAFAMDEPQVDPSSTPKQLPVTQKAVSLPSELQKHSPLCVFAQKDLVRKTPTCPLIEMEMEPFNFGALPSDIQAHTLFYIFDQEKLLLMTSTCKSLQAVGEKLHEKIWSQNRLLSVMSKALPTTWNSSEIFSTLKWGLFSENTNYLMWGSVIKIILKEVDENIQSRWGSSFEISDPDHDEDQSYSYDSDGSFSKTYILFHRQNLSSNDYPKIVDYTLFEAKVMRFDQRTYIWDIQGQYPTGENFSLKFGNSMDPYQLKCNLCSAYDD